MNRQAALATIGGIAFASAVLLVAVTLFSIPRVVQAQSPASTPTPTPESATTVIPSGSGTFADPYIITTLDTLLDIESIRRKYKSTEPDSVPGVSTYFRINNPRVTAARTSTWTVDIDTDPPGANFDAEFSAYSSNGSIYASNEDTSSVTPYSLSITVSDNLGYLILEIQDYQETEETVSTLRFNQPTGAVATHTPTPAPPTVAPTPTPTHTPTPSPPGVTLSTQTLTIPEGYSDTYTIRLNSQPSANVDIDTTFSPENIIIESPAISFTQDNWDEPQTVQIYARFRSGEGAYPPVTITHTASGGGYTGVDIDTVTVDLIDDHNTVAIVVYDSFTKTKESEIAEGTSVYIQIESSNSHPSDADFTINLSYGGTATSGDDYQTLGSSITLQPETGSRGIWRELFRTFTDSVLDEGDETVTISISGDLPDGWSFLGGGWDTHTVTIQDGNAPPTINPLPDYIAYSNNEVNIRAVASDPEGGALTYSWGLQAPIFANFPIGTALNTSTLRFTPPSPGGRVYYVVVGVTDNDGARDSEDFQLISYDPLPILTLDVTPGDGEVTLDWTTWSGSGARGYQYRIREQGRIWEAWETILGSQYSTRSHTVENLRNGTTYSFQVRAYADNGPSSSVSETVSATPSEPATPTPTHTPTPVPPTPTHTPTPLPTPASPTGLTAENNTNAGIPPGSVNLSWDSSTDPLITSYEYSFRRGTEAFGNWETAGYVTSTSVSPLETGTAYSFRVRAVSANGPSAPSNIATVTTISARYSPPETSDGVTFEVHWADIAVAGGTTSIDKRFRHPSDKHFFYRLIDTSDQSVITGRCEQGGSGQGIAGQQSSSEWDRWRLIPNIPAGTYQFTYSLYDTDPGANPDCSTVTSTLTPATFTIADGLTPARPVGLTATAGNAQVTLNWTDPSNSNITGYEYTQRRGSGAFSDWEAIPGSDATTTSHTFTGLDNGVIYYYRIRAVNGARQSAISFVVDATPAAPPYSHTRPPNQHPNTSAAYTYPCSPN